MSRKSRQPADGPLRAVLIGAGSFGANTLRALCASPAVQVAGVSDQDPAIAASAAAQAGCPAYSDHRRLLAQTHPHLVFLAVPPEPAAALVPLATEYQVHIWTGTPLARNLPEAVALCRLMEQAGLKFALGTPRRFMGGYRAAKGWLGRLGKVFLARGHYLFNAGPTTGWRADRSAGGGVLRELGSHMLDLVVWACGLPESVYCLAGSQQRPAGQADQPLYDTEDSAVCLLRYGDGSAASVTLSRCFSPLSEELAWYGQAGSLLAGANQCVLRDRDGAVVESFSDREPPAEVFTRQIDAFARAAAAEAGAYESSAWESLLTLAVIEAAHLSHRTGQPESPTGLLGRYGVSPDDCLKAAVGAQGPT